jgi:hypothetical protein
VPDAQVGQDCLRYLRVVNENDQPHGVLSNRAAQRVQMPDPRNQVGDGGMGIRGGAVCHTSTICARVSAFLLAAAIGIQPRVS